METVTISAKISEKKKAEFFQTTESLKTSISKYCSDFKINIGANKRLEIQIAFEDKLQMENYYRRVEFNILKGSLNSLCNDVEIKIGNVLVS